MHAGAASGLQSSAKQPAGMSLYGCAGSHFGSVVLDVLKTAYKVGDTVKVTFQSACPRNNVRTGDTFLAVQKLNEDTGEWTTVRACSPVHVSTSGFGARAIETCRSVCLVVCAT